MVLLRKLMTPMYGLDGKHGKRMRRLRTHCFADQAQEAHQLVSDEVKSGADVFVDLGIGDFTDDVGGFEPSHTAPIGVSVPPTHCPLDS